MRRYEGEIEAGWADGLGMYTTIDGKIFRGEFIMGLKEGCAPLRSPAHKRLATYQL